MSKVNKVTMNDALGTLKSMFPTYDDRTLKSYIYKTNGHLERTVELLLSKTEELKTGSTGNGNVSNNIGNIGIGSGERRVVDKMREGAFRHNLPPTFLRLTTSPTYEYRKQGGRSARTENLYKRPKRQPRIQQPRISPASVPSGNEQQAPRRVPVGPASNVGSINSSSLPQMDTMGNGPGANAGATENFNTKLKKRWGKWSEYTKRKFEEFTKKMSKKKDGGGEYQPLKMTDDDYDEEAEFEMKDESLL